jgi:hypothetical protein
MIPASKFQIHYFLNDESHSVDAFVRNYCEAEFLAIAKEVISVLGLEGITIEAEATREGGVKEVLKWIGKNDKQLAIVTNILNVILISSFTGLTYFTYAESQKSNPKDEILKDLLIEKEELSIKKLKQELEKENISETAIESLSSNHKVNVRRHNYYKKLESCPKVTQVGFSTLDTNNKYVQKEVIIPRTEFSKFFLKTDTLEPLIDEDARIEVVSPVFSEGQAKWKGVYNEEPIAFSMNDNLFKNDVLSKKVSFKRGSIIICVLHTNRKLNEVGEVKLEYVVETVLDRNDDGLVSETASGKQYRRKKEQDARQTKMEF